MPPECALSLLALNNVDRTYTQVFRRSPVVSPDQLQSGYSFGKPYVFTSESADHIEHPNSTHQCPSTIKHFGEIVLTTKNIAKQAAAASKAYEKQA